METRNEVFWFSSKNWRRHNDLFETDYTESPHYHYFSITDYRHDWENLLNDPQEWLHAVVVLTEPMLLLMNDPEYKASLFNLFHTFLQNTIKHSVLIQNDTYDGVLNIFKTNYYVKYLYWHLYKLHRTAFYQTFRCVDFKRTGNLSFKEFMSYYLVILVSQFHDHGYMDYAIDIMERTQGFFDEKEKELISNPGPRLSYNYETDLNGKDEKSFLKIIRDYNSPDEQLNEWDLASREWKNMGDWKEVKAYLSRYGNNRDTTDSRKKLQDTLDNKLFHILLDIFGLKITEESRSSYIVKTQNIVEEIKAIEELNVVPFDSNDGFQSYLDCYLGDSRHIVFQSYILHDKLYADEFDRFLSLFQEYMAKIRKIDIKIEKEQTGRGTLYTIKSISPELVKDNFPGYREDFRKLIDDIYQLSDDHIGEIISRYHLPPETAEALVQKYKRELNRIMIDTKYSRLSKISVFYRNLEEEANNQSLIIQNERALELQANLPSSILNPTRLRNDKALQDFMNGDPKYNKIYRKIEETIKQYADSEMQAELLTALNISCDSGLSEETRKKEKQKVVRFLKRISHLVGNIELPPEWVSRRSPYAMDSVFTNSLDSDSPESDELPF